MCIGCLVEYKVTFFQESQKYRRGYVEEIFRWRFGAAAAVGTHLRLMSSGYACSCCAFRVLRPWSSYASGTLASKRPHFTIERVACCDRGIYIGRAVAGISFLVCIFWPRSGVSKSCLGRQFGVWCRSSGLCFRGLRPWNSYAGTLALQEAAFYNWEGWMLRPWPVRSMCCCRIFFVFLHFLAT